MEQQRTSIFAVLICSSSQRAAAELAVSLKFFAVSDSEASDTLCRTTLIRAFRELVIRDTYLHASLPSDLDARQSSVEVGYNNLDSGDLWLKHASGRSRSVPVGAAADDVSWNRRQPAARSTHMGSVDVRRCEACYEKHTSPFGNCG